MNFYSRFFLIVLFYLLTACSSRYQSPVSEIQDSPRFITTDRTHRVNEGETLYAIALIYDLDFNYLASINALTEPYRIYSGQILSVDPRVNISTVKTPAEFKTTSSNRGKINSRPAAAAAIPFSPDLRSIIWQWPASGSVMDYFSSSDIENKGINLSGTQGDTVVAAAEGEVVYAGSGLLRYGELVIIKHNDRYLSSYAHNRKILVQEGERVKRGEKIAELGSTGVDREMLHFEIRDMGEPVDPLRFLPPR